MKEVGRTRFYFGQADASGRRGWISIELRCVACGHKDYEHEKILV